MGMSSVVNATLQCMKCGADFREQVQFKTGDDYGPDCEENAVAAHHEPGCYDGIANAYCASCQGRWVGDEKVEHFAALARSVESGELVVKRGKVRRDAHGMPVPDERDDFVVDLFEDRALTPSEILLGGRGRDIPGLWPNAVARFMELDYVIFQGGERVFPTRIANRSNWWQNHYDAVAKEMSGRTWPSMSERWIDIDVEVSEDRVVRLKRGTTKAYEREPRWISGVCPVMGVEIHYLRTGGAKPPVVMLHGLMGSGAGWSPIARALEAELDVIMPDARGHGASAAPEQGYRYADLEEEAYGLMGRLGLARPVVIGHSMGGMTAAVLASHLPGLIRAVVLIDPTFLSPERQRQVAESDVAEQHRQALQLTKEQLVEQARARSPHRSLEILERQAEARLQTSLAAFEVLTPPNPDYRELVRKIKIPALLVIGDEPVVTVEMAEELQRISAAAGGSLRVVQIANAGHGLPFDQPDQLAEVIRTFLRALP